MVRAAARGMTLVELMVGLLVASIVASIVMISLSIHARAHVRHANDRHDDDAAWLILAAVASDCKEAHWSVIDHTLTHRGQPFADGVASLHFLSEPHGLVELRLTLDDGRPFSRVVIAR